MRRLGYFLLLVIIVSASARCVNASTDCERWFAAYHKELMHTQQMQRIAAAKRRASLYAKRKLAGYVKPAPRPVLKPVNHHPMPRKQALHHVELACGVLPESIADQPLIAEETPAEFTPEIPLDDEVGMLPGFDGPGTILPEETLPTPPQTYSNAPGGGGAPVFAPPFTGAPGSGGSTPPPIVPPPVVPPAVPEPGSFVLLLTGGLGAANEIRRRLRA
jgi:hypothetical protein